MLIVFLFEVADKTASRSSPEYPFFHIEHAIDFRHSSGSIILLPTLRGHKSIHSIHWVVYTPSTPTTSNPFYESSSHESAIMSRIQIPLDVITSRLNFGDRFQGLRSGPLSGRFSNLRPVGEFLDFKRLSKPANFVEMQSRVNYNLSHYSSNYAVIFVMLSIYALLTNWLLLFDIILVVVGMWFIGKLDGHDLEIGTFRASCSQLYTALVCVAVPLGLIASPFTTLLWLIGASGVTILGGRPQSPEFAPQWGRPSRRSRRRTDGDSASRGRQGRDVRVEELDSDEDARGVGASSGTRFASDSLRFTGIDLGNRERGLVRRGDYQDSEDSEDDSDSSEDEEFEQYLAELAVRDREEALVQSAMHRIERAKAKGRTDVDLNEEEMGALERRRKRDEAAKKKKSGKKRKDQRVAVPLTQLEPSSRKKKAPPVSSQPRTQSRARQSSSNSNLTEDQDRSSRPSMGYFPPPATAGRPRSGTSSQRPQSRVRAPSNSRQPSDSSVIVRRGRNSSQAPLDPFQFQVPGAQASSPAGSWRQFSGAQRSSRGSRQINGSSEEESESEDESDEEREASVETTSSDDVGSGAQIVVEESSPEPSKPEPVRRNPPRTSASSSTSKRKPAANGGRRKK
ncbi:Prenylated Rab acceptor 1 [Fusarium oxysporum f. sp. raphani]|uniref:Prenylated Rab acceptor 1 n=1 Tax=Fusarium oxysporum f. sp. raphani TaxID=96318 RepID=A0A8J5UQC7_FUSOX|nr:Prenylated Rab acceptor 1 [Fusarium oxysporum f. sp. raphani]